MRFHRLFTAQGQHRPIPGGGRGRIGQDVGGAGSNRAHHRALWDEVERIDIIYICSNSNIARSNLQKLQVGGGAERSFATRLTMLATELASGDGTSLADSKLNFVSFTPGTSFNLRSSGGRADERVRCCFTS